MEGIEGGNEPQVLDRNNNTPIPKIEGNIEGSKKSYKKILIIIVIILLLGIGFWIYYTYFAKGYLEIKSKTENINIFINGNSYINQNNLKLSLEEGDYIVLIKKEGFLDLELTVQIQKLKKQNIDIDLPEIIANLTDIDDGVEGEISFSKLNINNIYYYIKDNYAFYNYEINGNKTELFKIPDSLQDFELINVKYSPDMQKAILTFENSDQSINYLADFKTSGVMQLNKDIGEIDWLNNSEIVYFIEIKDGNYLSTANYNGSNWKNLELLQGESYGLERIEDNQFSYFIINNDITNLVIRTKESLLQNIVLTNANEFVLGLNKWDKNKLVASIESEKNKLIDTNGKIQDLAIDPYLNLFTWMDDTKISYIESLSDNQYSLMMLDINNNVKKQIYTNYNYQEVKDIFYYKNIFYFLINNYVVRINSDQ